MAVYFLTFIYTGFARPQIFVGSRVAEIDYADFKGVPGSVVILMSIEHGR